MSAATACMPLVPPSPLHGSPAMAAVERRQPAGAKDETAKTDCSELGTVGCVVKSHGNNEDCAGGDGDVMMSRPRPVVQILTCERKPFIEGFALWRAIGRPELQELDPILSFNEFEFSAPAGFPDHPHRGFENITYMLEGGISYHDFSGHKGTINTGDVQRCACSTRPPRDAVRSLQRPTPPEQHNGAQPLLLRRHREASATRPLRRHRPGGISDAATPAWQPSDVPAPASQPGHGPLPCGSACSVSSPSTDAPLLPSGSAASDAGVPPLLPASFTVYTLAPAGGPARAAAPPAHHRRRSNPCTWLTAGRGVVHAEMPAGQGVQRGINIWINLSAADKMVEPKYQDLASHDIPTASADDGVSVKVIAGECLGTRSPLRPRTPALCLDVTLRPGARLRQPVPREWSACAYVVHGEAAFSGSSRDDDDGSTTTVAAARTLVVFGGNGDCVEVRCQGDDAAGQQGARVMLVAARPHGEAVVRDGPFVMNTAEEVEQARDDYRRRRNGFEMADGWTSDHASAVAMR